MFVLEKTEMFDKWLKSLKDRKAKAKILFRLQKLEDFGHFGDFKHVGDGIIELRIHDGKGYRVYIKKYRERFILLLIGGNKPSQTSDIQKAKIIWKKHKTDLKK